MLVGVQGALASLGGCAALDAACAPCRIALAMATGSESGEIANALLMWSLRVIRDPLSDFDRSPANTFRIPAPIQLNDHLR